MVPSGSRKPPPSLHAQAVRGHLQPYSPSAQVKAAPDQVGDRNWNWGKNLMFDYEGSRERNLSLRSPLRRVTKLPAALLRYGLNRL
jgi:hypothetical protein